MSGLKYDLLYHNLTQLSDIPLDEWDVLLSKLEEKQLKKGEYFIKAGDMASSAAFIISGYTRMFYTTPEGQEFNHVFMFENMVMAGYPSLILKEPNWYHIQAMEDCNILVIEYTEFEKLFERHPCWEKLGRKVAELNYIDKASREYLFLCADATTRYKKVLEQYPDIEKRVPQYHLASFLGITASALNRIIKKLKATEGEEG